MKAFFYLSSVLCLIAELCYAANIPSQNKSFEIKNDLELVDNEGDIYEYDFVEVEMHKSKTFKIPKGTKNILVTDPTIADVNVQNEDFFDILGVKTGETNIKITTVDKDGNRNLISKKVLVSHNLSMIRRELKKRFSSSKISIDNLGTSVVLSGTVANPKIAADIMELVGKLTQNEKNIVNNMSIGVPTQVMLKVKVAKLDRNVSKSLGINWRSFSLGSAFNIAGTGGSAGGALPLILTSTSAISAGIANTGIKSALPAGLTDAAATAGNFTDNPDTAATVPGNGARFVMNYTDRHGNSIGSVIDALAEESLATVLAEPTLVALSGEKAEFQSGGEQPYRSASTSGTAVSTTEFKDWGIILKFTPNVISENRISINLDSEISAVESTEGANSEPPLTKQNVKTTVELGSGQSLAIAGLLKKEASKKAVEMPGLASIPLIGGLFRSSSDTLKESELVIIITPYIVKPSSKPLVNPVERAPKLISPVRCNFMRRFTEQGNEATNNAGFTVS